MLAIILYYIIFYCYIVINIDIYTVPNKRYSPKPVSRKTVCLVIGGGGFCKYGIWLCDGICSKVLPVRIYIYFMDITIGTRKGFYLLCRYIELHVLNMNYRARKRRTKG